MAGEKRGMKGKGKGGGGGNKGGKGGKNEDETSVCMKKRHRVPFLTEQEEEAYETSVLINDLYIHFHENNVTATE